MMVAVKYLSLPLLLMLMACGPQFRTVTDYHPPITEAGQQCIGYAQQDKQACDNNCTLSRNACLARARELADREYQRELAEYQAEYTAYKVKKDLYDDQRDLRKLVEEREYTCKHHPDASCNDHAHRVFEASLVSYPHEPSEPYFDTILRSHSRDCDHDCGCQRQYDNAFQSCGGVIAYREVCVSNCE